MPEVIKSWAKLNPLMPGYQILKGYLTAAFWCDLEESSPNLGFDRLTNDSIKKSYTDCLQFITDNKVDIGNVNMEQVGHDLWLSRNGHGSGFFDRTEMYGCEQAKRLQDAARKFGEKHMSAYRGWVYID